MLKDIIILLIEICFKVYKNDTIFLSVSNSIFAAYQLDPHFFDLTINVYVIRSISD